ncbi:alpha/beta-hydrolase [Penicillium capsulatum]|uniref:Alpha/beta-hydrolase n=1 Tax=Penicillium capsulatum TaxID=69766 RepID=A0A9W9IKP8_9EURO|nr:alpha/beta-hydrolase [Penicillium capsulatum]KAJ6121334.1 alpha/beta-hydrolase [Penicillium capsulatum]
MPGFKSIVSASALVALCAGSAPSPAKADPALKWTDCHKGLKCANLTVPLNWETETEKNITLGIGMLPAADKAKRIGYLFTNPGGPGGSAIEDLVGKIEIWKASKLHEYFDLVAPDPRGTTYSTPVSCDPAVWNVRVPQIPRTKDEFNEMAKAYLERGRSCAEKSGDLLNHVDTVSAVRDLEHVRRALGDEPMNFIGFSYGSQLGAQYAEYFPHNIRALALDGILDHSEPDNDFWLQESNGYEVTVNQFFAWCKQNSTCALHKEADLPAKFDAFIDRANDSPVPAPGCDDPNFGAYPCYNNVTGYELLKSMQGVISFPYPDTPQLPGWAGLSSMLEQAMSGNASLFAQPKFDKPTRGEFAYAAIFCQDWNRAHSTALEYMIKRTVAEVQSPHTRGQGEMWYLQAMCMHWPAPVNNPPHSYARAFADRKMKTPILMTNAIYDPETPIQWAWTVLQQMGEDNTALVMRNGSGHTSYYHPGATRNIIEDYLINLKVPVSGTIVQD